MLPEPADIMLPPVTPIAEVDPAPMPFATKIIASNVPVPLLVMLVFETVINDAAWSVKVLEVVQVMGADTVILPVLAPAEPTVEMSTLQEPFSAALRSVLRIWFVPKPEIA